MEKKGVAFTLEPAAGILQPFGQQRIEITGFSDMWGQYTDALISKVSNFTRAHTDYAEFFWATFITIMNEVVVIIFAWYFDLSSRLENLNPCISPSGWVSRECLSPSKCLLPNPIRFQLWGELMIQHIICFDQSAVSSYSVCSPALSVLHRFGTHVSGAPCITRPMRINNTGPIGKFSHGDRPGLFVTLHYSLYWLLVRYSCGLASVHPMPWR